MAACCATVGATPLKPSLPTYEQMSRLTRSRATEIISRFPTLRIVVVGDLMIDAYIWGKVSRISQEAPIPVVEVTKDEARPGGAGNVGLNMLALGAHVEFCGVVGKDIHADVLRADLTARGAGISGVLTTEDRPTTVKTRVIAQHQQMLRIDRENAKALPEAACQALCEAAKPLIAKADGVVFSDYNKGVLQASLVTSLLEASKGRTITVDPKPQNMHLFRGAALITPNKKEAEAAVGFALRTEADVHAAAEKLREDLQLGATLITRGEEGMSLYDGKEHMTIPTQAKQVFDVTGAGDTVISVATLALCAGATPEEASILANVAAGISVAHIGVYTVSAAELIEAV